MAARALICEWCDRQVMCAGAVPATFVCLVLSLLLSAWGLVSLFVYVSAWVRAPDAARLCRYV